MDDKRCATCRWWDTSTFSGRHEEFSPCRVSPPVVGLGSDKAIWPMVEGDDWCASHAPDVPPPPPPPPSCGHEAYSGECEHCMPF